MSTPESKLSSFLVTKQGGGNPPASNPSDRLSSFLSRKQVVAEPEDPENDLIQAGAGVLEGILDPLSVIPFVDRRLEQLRQYRGDDIEGKVGYGIGAIGGFFLPAAPANLTLKAGTAIARGLKLTKAVENAEDLASVADKMQELSIAGMAMQGAVSGGLLGAGMPLEEGEDRSVQVLQNMIVGGIADPAFSLAWKAISAGYRSYKSIPVEMKKLGEEALTTGIADNAPLVTDSKTAVMLGRALSLADEVLGEGAELEAKTELGLNLTKVFSSVEAGRLRMIPAVGKTVKEFEAAVKNEGLDIVYANRNIGGDEFSTYLVGEKGSISAAVADEFAENGFLYGQSVNVLNGKGTTGTILGKGEKPGSLKILMPGKKVSEVPREKLYLLPVSYTKAARKSIGPAQKLWVDFYTNFESSFSSDVLSKEADLLAKASGEAVEKPARLSFEGAFDKFVKEKGISGMEREVLKDYFVRKQSDELEKIIPEEMEILRRLRATNKEFHPEGSLNEMAGLRGYKVKPTKQNGKTVYSVMDRETGQSMVFGTKELAEGFVKNHMRDLKNPLNDAGSPIADEILDVGGVAAVKDEAGLEAMLSPEVIEKMNSSILDATRLMPRAGLLRRLEDVAASAGQYFPVFTEYFDRYSRANIAWNNAKVPYLDRAVKIVKGGLGRRNIRPEKHDEWVALVETNPSEWAGVNKTLGLNEREIKAAREVRELLDEVWQKEGMIEKLGMTSEDYISNYWPRIREYGDQAFEGEGFNDYLTRTMLDRKQVVSEKIVSFFGDLERTGTMVKYQTDPVTVLTKYINGITFKNHAADEYAAADDVFKKLKEMYGDDPKMKENLAIAYDYSKLMKGMQPEDVGTMQRTFQTLMNKMGLDKYVDDETVDRMINVYGSLNYGAFLAFRPAKAIINFTQIGHIYVKDGAKYTGHAVKMVFGRGGKAAQLEAMKEGAVKTQGLALPYADDVQKLIDSRKSGVADTIVGKGIDLGLAATEFGGRMFSKADHWLRAVAYHSQKQRAIDAFNKYGKLERNKDFEIEAGLSQMGEAVTQKYFQVLRDGGNEAAAKWLGVRSAHDTQYLYQTGAGPIAFARGPMKLFGQYGSWGSWYVDWARRGFTVGTFKERAQFVSRTAIFAGGITATGYAIGVNTARWHGPSAMFYGGGPMWDKAKDFSTVWSNVMRPGGPSVEAKMVMAKYGIKYNDSEEDFFPYEIASTDEDPLKGVGKLVDNTVGLVTPGNLLRKDIMQGVEAYEDKGPYEAFLLAAGFDLNE